MRVAALTSGRGVPSARFRIRQHLPNLSEAGLDVREYCPIISQVARLPGALGKVRARYLPPLIIGQTALNLALRVPGILGSHQADVTWLERNFIPGLDDAAMLLGHPLIVDIDDAIWLYNPMGRSQIARLVSRAEMIFAGNSFIADWCSQFCKTIQIIPTAVDADRFVPRATPKAEGAPFIIGWTGTSGNFRFLKMIEKPLEKFLHNHPSARLMIVADRAPDDLMVPSGQLIFRQWDPKTEHLLLQDFDVGIMPIDNTEISRGKCSFKMLQYMAVGLPVIVSPYGMNREVLNMSSTGMGPETCDEWFDCLQAASRRMGAHASQAAESRNIIVENFSVEKISKRIASAFNSVCNDY